MSSACAADETVDIFAAASLKNALDSVADRYEQETGETLRLTFAGSSTLARQIEFGAPADIFISANVAWMDMLDEVGRLEEGSRRDLLTNSLVVIAFTPDGEPIPAPLDLTEPHSIKARLGDALLATALVDAVPAGQYAKAALTSLGQWGDLEGRIAQADNVRAALALVSTGAVPLGVVYATDAAVAQNVEVVAEFPRDSHPPIRYPASMIEGAAPEARAVLDFLNSPEAADIFAAQGFGVIGDETR
ncbi:molybdate ABC transporter substrate-binding protein [Celeribacter sp.]|uniref:molybdate ABC transporter substrate-binding protein n=1 Tax=Celeribacter sp. TaxID=1890673 RepID=UPI003A91CA63